MSSPRPLALLCHAATPAPRATTLAVTVRRLPDGGLHLAYRLQADLRQIALPPPQAAGPEDGLWQHTCFEAFVGVPGSPAYREYNFSPSGRWAVYAFNACRQRQPGFSPALAPRLAVRRFPDRLAVDAELVPALLPAASGLEIGVAAVVEAADGGMSYWALAHAGPRPDFHLRQGFVLRLAPPVATA